MPPAKQDWCFRSILAPGDYCPGENRVLFTHYPPGIHGGLNTEPQDERMSTETTQGQLIDKVIKIRRCAAVVKGGRRFSFTALVVVGDGQGSVGWGYGKANEVPPAVEKAVKDGSRNLVSIHMEGTTIPHTVQGPIRRGPGGAGSGRSRHGRDRRVVGPRGLRSLRHPRHPHQELRLHQSDQPGQSHHRRPASNCARKHEVERLRGVSLT